MHMCIIYICVYIYIYMYIHVCIHTHTHFSQRTGHQAGADRQADGGDLGPAEQKPSCRFKHYLMKVKMNNGKART